MSAMGWDLVDPGLAPDPLRGEVDDYLDAAAHVGDVAAAVGELGGDARTLAELPGAGTWSGTAAGAFVTHLTAAATAIAAGGPLLDAVATVCRAHADTLADLRARSATALAVARERRDDLDAAWAQLAGAQAALAAAEHQLAAVRALPDGPTNEYQVALLEQRRWNRQAAVQSRRAVVVERQAELAASGAEHRALGEAEAALRSATAATLAGIAPGPPDLPGPPWTPVFSAVFGTVTNQIAAVAEQVMEVAFAQLAAAIADALLAFPFGLDPAWLDTWAAWLGDLPRDRQAVLLTMMREVHRERCGASPPGDLGGTYDWEPRGRWPGQRALDGDPDSRAARPATGAATVVAALTLLRDSRTLAPDEFGVVELHDGRAIVVLPGVTDLTNPDRGWSEEHRTVRDLDQAAYGSSKSTSVTGNRYAQMVAAGLAEFGIEQGTDVLIVGHSFGADTALDLAADPHFNGPDGYRVTHVVAAGYHSQPQLPHVPASTEVLVLQNDGDLAIGLERFGEHPAQLEEHVTDGWDDLWNGDLAGVGGAIWGAAGDAFRFGEYLAEEAAEMRPIAPLPGLPGLPAPAGGSRVTAGEHHVVARFDGLDAGFGHHPDNYRDYLERLPDTEVAAFTATLVAAGYTGPGEVYAIDVSVPGDRGGSGSW